MVNQLWNIWFFNFTSWNWLLSSSWRYIGRSGDTRRFWGVICSLLWSPIQLSFGFFLNSTRLSSRNSCQLEEISVGYEFWLREYNGISGWDNLSLISGLSISGKSDNEEDEDFRARFATIVRGEGGVGELGGFFWVIWVLLRNWISLLSSLKSTACKLSTFLEY